MFQFATLLSLAKLKKTSIVIPQSAGELIDTFPMVSQYVSSDIPAFPIYKEEGFLYSSNIFLLQDDIDIEGYFQSEQYFLENKDIVADHFQFKQEISHVCEEKISLIKSNHTANYVCGVHIRRGDYLKIPEVHTNLTLEYYMTAMSWMAQNYNGVTFLIVSDDIEWCRQNMEHPDVIFSDFTDQAYDMCVLQKCDLHVIANSSFSWWPAWLSNSKQVIAPKTWFGPSGPPEWYSLYCKDWGILNAV